MENKWRGSALCAQTDPEAFFPANKAYADEYNGYNNYNEARKICAECPVKGECLADALMTGDVEYGMRGGLTPRERMGILATKVAACEEV